MTATTVAVTVALSVMLSIALTSGLAPAGATGLSPTADAGGPYTIAEGQPLVLDATGSTDPEGDTLTAAWDLDGDGSYDDAAGINPTLAWPQLAGNGLSDDGTYPIAVEIGDGTTTAIATGVVTVTNSEPTVVVRGTGRTGVGHSYEIFVDTSDPGTDTVTGWMISWGDGTTTSGSGRPSTASHSYGVAGLRHGITVSVTDEDGTWTTADLAVPYYDGAERVVRIEPDSGVEIQALGSTGGSLASAYALTTGPDDSLYVTGSSSATVERYDQVSNGHLNTFVAAGAGGLSGPRGLTFGPDGHLLVASAGTGSVLRYHPRTGAFVDTFVATGTLSSPDGLAFGTDGNLYVTDRADDVIERYDGDTGAHLGTFAVLEPGSRPSGLAFGPDGNLYVALSGAGRVDSVDGATGAVLGPLVTTGLTQPTGLGFGPDGALWVADYWTDEISRFDATTGAALGPRVTGTNPAGPQHFEFLADHRVRVTAAPPIPDPPRSTPDPAPSKSVAFEANVGQFDPAVDYLARMGRDRIYLVDGDVTFEQRDESGSGHALAMRWVDRSAEVTANPGAGQPGATSYLLGDDPAQWKVGVSSHGTVSYADIYPQIDVKFLGQDHRFRYDLRVRPGGDPDHIGLAFDGASAVTITPDGYLAIEDGAREAMQFSPPVSYQNTPGGRTTVDSRYIQRFDGSIGFEIGTYDSSLPLIIDPTLDAATYIGSTGADEVTDLVVDGAGNVYVTGSTNSVTYPATAGPIGPTGSVDAIVTKFAPDLGSVIYTTYIGGKGDDVGHGIDIDAAGAAYVGGRSDWNATDNDFPVTPGAHDSTFGNGNDGFVLKLNPAGTALDYSTYLGTNGSNDEVLAVAVDGAGRAHVTGQMSSGLTTSTGAYQQTYGGGMTDAFVAILDATGTGVDYSTYLGGGVGGARDIGYDLAIDDDGHVHIVGQTNNTDFPVTPATAYQTSLAGGIDGYYAELDPTAAAAGQLLYSTYLGGGAQDQIYDVDLAGGLAYLAGRASDSVNGFPTTAGAFDGTANGNYDAVLALLDSTGSGPGSLVYSTFVGHSGQDEANGVAVDGWGRAHLTGTTRSASYPTTVDADDKTLGGTRDGFLTVIDPGRGPDGALLYSTFFGGSAIDQATDIGLDDQRDIYLGGTTGSADLGATTGAYDLDLSGSQDGFVTTYSALPAAETGSLRFATDGEVTAGNAPGAPWEASNIVDFGGSPTYEPGGTSGTPTALFDLDDHASDGNADIGGLHYLTRNVTIGSTEPLQLLGGDLLISTDSTEAMPVTINGASPRSSDILAFRPDTPGDYTSGSWLVVLDGSDVGLSAIEAFTVVETAMTVGGQALDAGDILVNNGEDLDRLVLTTAGEDSADSSLATFLDASDLGVAATNTTNGAHLLATGMTLGDRTLAAGTILWTLASNELAGHSSITAEVKHQDAVALTLTGTGPATTTGAASELFDGSDVGLDTAAERVHALAIWASPEPDPPIALDDEQATSADTSAVVDVLANDLDSGAEPLTVESVTQPGSGSVVNNGTDVTYTPAPGWTGTETFTYVVADGVTGTDTATVTVSVGQALDELLLTTAADTIVSTAPGLAAWTGGEALSFGDPDLALESPATDGTFGVAFDVEPHVQGGVADLDALHVVGTAMTVGTTNPVSLEPGDLLFSMVVNETLQSGQAVMDEDVVLFEPDDPTYTTGTFTLLYDLGLFSANDTRALTLVEQPTVIAGVNIPAGTLFIGREARRDIIRLDMTEVGPATAGTESILADGATMDLGSEIRGLELVEQPVAIGGRVIPAGRFLATLAGNDAVIGNTSPQTAAQNEDLFQLDVETPHPGTVAAAYPFLDGSDVNLGAAAQDPVGVSLVPNIDWSPLVVDDAMSTDQDTTDGLGAPGVLGNDRNPDARTLYSMLSFDAIVDSNIWVDDHQTGHDWRAGGWGSDSTFVANPPETSLPGIGGTYRFTGLGLSGAGFAGGNSFQILPSDPTNASASAEVWFRPDTLTGQQIVWESGGATGDGTSLYLDGSLLKLAVRNASTTEVSVDLNTLGLGDPTTEFIQAVATIDFETDTVSLFVNGNLAASGAFTGTDWSGGAATGLGRAVTGAAAGSGQLDGDIAIFRFYERALAPSQITANHQAVATPQLSVTTVDGSHAPGSIKNLTSGARIRLNSDGSLIYDPNGAFDSVPAGGSTTDSFTYTATETGGGSATATVIVTIDGRNDPPMAEAGGPYTIAEGEGLSLDGSGSSDIDDDSLDYAWDIDLDGQYDDATGVSPSLTWNQLRTLGLDDDGPYIVGLEVDDGLAGPITDTASLTIDNTPPEATATGPATIAIGDPYSLSLSVTDPGDDLVTSWTIDWGDGTVDPITGNPASASHTYTVPGRTADIRVTATDEDGTFLAGNAVLAQFQGDRALALDATSGAQEIVYPTNPALDGPTDVLLGDDGLLYVPGYYSNDIVRYDAVTGAFVDVFVPPLAGGLDGPAAIMFGPDGHLWVASFNNSTIKRYDGESGAYVDDVVPSGTAGLSWPSGMTIGPDGQLYVSSWNTNVVFRFNATTGAFTDYFVTTNLTAPTGIVFGPDGKLYVASRGSGAVNRFDGTTGTFEATLATLPGAYGLDVGFDDRLYVTSQTAHLLNAYKLDGTEVTAIATATEGLAQPIAVRLMPAVQVVVTGPPTADLGGPYDIAEGQDLLLDGSGSTDPDGHTLTYAWDLTGDGNYDDATGAKPSFDWTALAAFGITDEGSYPIGLQVDDSIDGADTTSGTLTVTNTAPDITVGGAATIGDRQQYTLTVGATDPGADTITSWAVVWGDGRVSTGPGPSFTHTYLGHGQTRNILVSATDEDGTWWEGDLFVPGFNSGTVHRYAPGTAAPGTSFGAVSGGFDATIGPDGTLYASAFLSDAVERYDPATGNHIGTFVAAGSGGLDGPAGLSFGPDGNLYVSSGISNSVLRYDGSTGAFIDTFVSAGDGGLASPADLTFGPDGHLYVAGWISDAVHRYDGSSGTVIDSFVTVGNGGLNGPEGLLFHPSGDLLVASAATDEVLRYDGVSGSPTGPYVTAGSGGLDAPKGLAVGPDGLLYVGSEITSSVLRYDLTSGSFVDVFVPAGGGGLDLPTYPSFQPDHQVLVTETFDLNGSVFEDPKYGGGPGRPITAAGTVGRGGASVEIYDGSGKLEAATTTAAAGTWSVAAIDPGAHTVRVVNATVTSSRPGGGTTELGVQTFRPDGAGETIDTGKNRIGGEQPVSIDAPANGGGQTLAALQAPAGQFTQSIVELVVADDVTGIDFGFNFDTIVNTNDEDQGSLRQFLANAATLDGDAALAQRGRTAGIETSIFQIPTTDPGYALLPAGFTIQPVTPLLIATTVALDGTTQSQYSDEKRPVIQLDGSLSTAAQGLEVTASSSVVRGLAVNRFDTGVAVTGGDGTVIAGNHLGPDLLGTIGGVGNTSNGLLVAGATNTVVGGTAPRDRNVISGNGVRGVHIDDWTDGPTPVSNGTVVIGNHIGVDAAGTAALTFDDGGDVQQTGVAVFDGPGTVIGGPSPAEGNVISGNSWYGVHVWGPNAIGSVIQGNIVGRDATATGAVPNGTDGAKPAVLVDGGVDSEIGGLGTGSGNVIANNAGPGVVVSGALALGNSIVSNRIVDNGGLGIDLGADGVTGNDGGDADSGPNHLLNHPEIDRVTASGGALTVAGTLDAPAGTYRVELFTNPSGGDPSGWGEGDAIVGAVTVVHPGGGPRPWAAEVAGNAGDIITVTATELPAVGATGASSEFSPHKSAVALSSASVTDLSRRRSDLVATSGLDPSATVPGPSAGALTFGGGSQRLAGPAIDITSPGLTLAAWIKPSPLGPDPRIVAKTSTAGSTVYELYVDTAVAPVVGPGPQPKSGSGSAAVNIRLNGVTHNVSGGSVTAGAWHHMAATWDGSTIRLYLDGVEVGATSATGVLAVDHTLPVTVGNVNAGDRGFEGAIDNVQILSTAAPAAAIATHHGNLAASGAFHSFGQEQTGAPGPWTVAAVGRTGGHSLEAPSTNAGAAAWAVATGLDEPGMVLEGWWLYSSDTGVDIAAGTRAGTDPTDELETWLGSPSGWGLRHRNGSTEIEDAAPSGTPAAGSWTKVELHTDQNGDSRVVVDGTELIGSTAQGPVPATGSVGFRVGALPGTESWQIDDVRGRRLVAPEPVTTLGPLDRS